MECTDEVLYTSIRRQAVMRVEFNRASYLDIQNVRDSRATVDEVILLGVLVFLNGRRHYTFLSARYC